MIKTTIPVKKVYSFEENMNQIITIYSTLQSYRSSSQPNQTIITITKEQKQTIYNK